LTTRAIQPSPRKPNIIIAPRKSSSNQLHRNEITGRDQYEFELEFCYIAPKICDFTPRGIFGFLAQTPGIQDVTITASSSAPATASAVV
jgi:hypothetical protein